LCCDSAIAPAIADAEQHRAMRRPPGSLGAWAAYQRGLWHLSRSSIEDNALAEKFFEQAIDLDPTFGGGYRGLAWAQIQAAATFMTRSLAEVQSRAEALARRAVALDEAGAEARASLGYALLARGDHEGACAEAKQAMEISPNLAAAHGTLGAALTFSGRPEEGLAALAKCIRLDPRDPEAAIRLLQVAVAHYFSGGPSGAASWQGS
jgi:adenylate cyclase